MQSDNGEVNHRGHGKTIVFPENELAAARQALKDGQDRVEARYLLGWWPILLLFFIGFLVRSGFIPERDDYIENIIAEAAAVVV